MNVDLRNELKLEKVRKRIDDFVLTADFTLAAGERAALIGRSGIGKSTLLRMIAGLEPLLASRGDEGRILFRDSGGGDQDITGWRPEMREVGLVFQEAALFPALDVLENVIFGLRHHRGMPVQQAREEAYRWLEKVGMKSKARAPVGQLSGGEAQRVAFVRALIWKPRLILLDEPFSALDTEMRAALRSELLELHRLHPVPLLLVSHDIQDLEAIANVRLEVRPVLTSSDQDTREVIRTDLRQ